MSLFEDAEKDRPNLFRAPPIRKLFSSQTIEESDQDSRHELETFKVFVRIKPVSDDYSLVFFYFIVSIYGRLIPNSF